MENGMELEKKNKILLFLEDSDSDLCPLEESLSSSSDEEFLILSSTQGHGTKRKIPRIENYVEKVVSNYNAVEFKSHFRMFPETFEFVLHLIGPQISKTCKISGRKPIGAKKQILLTLWTMATPDSYRSVCQRFNVGKATALRSVRRVSYALHSLAPKFIVWPVGECAKEVARDFERYSAFPNVRGAIDGTHIRIRAPKNDPQSFINRKGVHSIQVQAVCTHNLLFTSVFAGNVGSVHDARVFRLSPVYQYIQDPEKYFESDSHLVGDAAYGIHPNIMVPYKENGHLTERQKNFNFSLSSARMAIERAFGVWKARWRSILDCLPMVTIEKIPEYLLALAVLHNICILKGDIIQSDIDLRLSQRGQLLSDQRRQEGILKRERISNSLIIRNI